MADYDRPATARQHVAAGKGSGRYAYEMVYCAAKTSGDNPWLLGFQSEVDKRMAGMDGTTLEKFIHGQTTLF